MKGSHASSTKELDEKAGAPLQTKPYTSSRAKPRVSGLTTLVKAVGNNVVLELEVTDIEQEVGEGKADECEV